MSQDMMDHMAALLGTGVLSAGDIGMDPMMVMAAAGGDMAVAMGAPPALHRPPRTLEDLREAALRATSGKGALANNNNNNAAADQRGPRADDAGRRVRQGHQASTRPVGGSAAGPSAAGGGGGKRSNSAVSAGGPRLASAGPTDFCGRKVDAAMVAALGGHVLADPPASTRALFAAVAARPSREVLKVVVAHQKRERTPDRVGRDNGAQPQAQARRRQPGSGGVAPQAAAAASKKNKNRHRGGRRN
jgi:hypothetical protein